VCVYSTENIFPRVVSGTNTKWTSGEIKEQTMRTASQLERPEKLLELEANRQTVVGWPQPFVAHMPVFFQDLVVGLRRENIVREIEDFDVSMRREP
jgi:hypothetical protein